MRRVVAALAVSLAVFASLAVVQAPAQAVNRCTTQARWDQLREHWKQSRVHTTLNSTGVLLDRKRSGARHRKLDTWRGYTSCAYADDTIVINFDDYTAPGSNTRGGPLRLYGGVWEHYCLDSTPIYDDMTGEEIGYTCYDTGWEGDYYYEDEFDARRLHGRTAARGNGHTPASAPIVDSFGTRK